MVPVNIWSPERDNIPSQIFDSKNGKSKEKRKQSRVVDNHNEKFSDTNHSICTLTRSKFELHLIKIQWMAEIHSNRLKCFISKFKTERFNAPDIVQVAMLLKRRSFKEWHTLGASPLTHLYTLRHQCVWVCRWWMAHRIDLMKTPGSVGQSERTAADPVAKQNGPIDDRCQQPLMYLPSLFLVFQLRLLLCFGQSNTGASVILSQIGFTSDAESPTLFTTSNNVLWGSSSEEIETRAAGEIISFKKQPKPLYDWTGGKYNSTIYFVL